MKLDYKKEQAEQCAIPVIVCSVLSKDGSYTKFECSCFKGKDLTKASFNTVIDWLNKEKEKYPDAF